ncbi:MAG: chromosome segregation protein SMC [Clostridia bacterium]|nr:chromosome segregation protein SMC [Clostridia bacterium]
MYLKALEMQGFKSFPDKTVLSFGDGVTAVVGPNGSGKSNIADAVRWVLGEQSTKSLRGQKMEDVIFSGTGERRPQGFAEVTLRLDNADGALNNPEFEVTVTRRYYRSGESVYMINGKPVRLKDVNELFMDTGLGRDGYSMVGQGKIEEMVSARSENRRDMFEEAAGISHYRYRRADAIKRLDQAEENLVRLRDIVAELASRVGPLEKQSQKAQQFLVYAAERKELEIGLWVHTLNKSVEQIREQNNRLSVAQSQYDVTGQILEKLSADIDDAAEGTREINVETERLRGEKSQYEEQAAALDAQAAVYDNTVAHNDETLERLRRDIESQDSADGDIEKEIGENRAQIAALEQEAERQSEALRLLTDKLAGLKKSDDEYSDGYNAASEELSQIMLRLSQTDIMISASESSAQEIRTRMEAAEETVRQKRQKIEELTARRDADKAAVDAAAEKAAELGNMAGGYALRVNKAASKTEELKTASEKAKLELLSKQQRLRFLEDTEKNMEGYQGSVKAVLREASHGTLTGIRGTLIDLIRVEEEYQTAIETALGNAIQDIVTETEQDAKRAINMLKSTNAGRATFLPISSVEGRILREEGLDGQYGFIDLAHRLVDCDAEYDEIVRSLLGRIAVCEDLDCAIAIAKRYNYKFKIVTLDGQVINAGGSMTGGSKVTNSGFLSRRTEIDRLKKECADMQEGIAQRENGLKAALERYSNERASYDAVKAEQIEQNEEKVRLEGVLATTAAKLAEAEQSLADTLAEQESAGERIAYLGENVTIAQKEREKIEAEKAAKEQELRSLSGGRDTLLAERETINNEITEVNLRAVAVMKEQESKKELIVSLERRRAELAMHKDELAAERESIQAQNEDLRKQAEATRESAALIRSQAAKTDLAIEELIEKREGYEKTVTQARAEEKQRSEEREKLGAELVRLEERRNALEKEQNEIERRLFEDYALSRREAMETAPEIESVGKAQKRLSELKGQIKALGAVNVAAIDEYKEVSSRYEFLSGQVNDVEKAKKELLRMIEELTQQMSEQFRDRFNAINNHFSETFTQLFGGGEASLVLEDEDDILECAIDIKAQPPGKKVKNLTLLSGGEKGLTAIALLFAILKVRPAPFCIFDEVEAALDDVNVLRYAQYVRMMTGDTQFILITHRRGTMEEADILYGVTMQERGVSKLLELKTAEMVEKLRLDE